MGGKSTVYGAHGHRFAYLRAAEVSVYITEVSVYIAEVSVGQSVSLMGDIRLF